MHCQRRMAPQMALQDRVEIPSGLDVLTHSILREEKVYRTRNPGSEEQFRRAKRCMPGGTTRATVYFPPFPLTIERASNGRVYDVDGHGYLNFVGEYTAGVYGHDDSMTKRVLAAIGRHGTLLSGPTQHEDKLARLICHRFGFDQIRFCNSGTEANLLALALARHVTQRTGVLGFKGAYHGGSLVLMDGRDGLNVPVDMVLGQYNDVEGTRALIRENAAKLGAIIVEPMMGAAGCIPALPEFLKMLRDVSREHGIVLIFDEVMTSRLGPAGLQGELGIHADLTTLGKYLGGGFSMGALAGIRELMACFDPASGERYLSHGGTFNNNVASMIAGYIGLTEYFTEDAAMRLNARGDKLRRNLNEVARSLGLPVQVTGIGSVMNLHLHDGDILCPSDIGGEGVDEFKRLFHLHMLNRGIYVAARGLTTLNLNMHEAYIAAFEDEFSRFLEIYGRDLSACVG